MYISRSPCLAIIDWNEYCRMKEWYACILKRGRFNVHVTRDIGLGYRPMVQMYFFGGFGSLCWREVYISLCRRGNRMVLGGRKEGKMRSK